MYWIITLGYSPVLTIIEFFAGIYRLKQLLIILNSDTIFFFVWQILIVKENKGNEGTCVGVSKWPIRDYTHRTTTDMWLYRAYSGNLYHGGEQTMALNGFTQGDFITVVLDMDAKTLAFGKNGEVCLFWQSIYYLH